MRTRSIDRKRFQAGRGMDKRVRLTKLHVRNYRSCSDTTFKPMPGLSVLIGPNGSGKTNILSTVLLLRALLDIPRSPSDEIRKCNLIAWFETERTRIILRATVILSIGDGNSEGVVDSKQKWYVKRLHRDRRPHFVSDLPLAALANPGGKWRIDQPSGLLNRAQYWRYREGITSERHFRHLKSLLRVDKNIFGKIAMHILTMKYYSASQFTNPRKCPISFQDEERRYDLQWAREGGGSHSRFLKDMHHLRRTNRPLFDEFINMIGPKGVGLVERIDFSEHLLSTVEHSVYVGGRIKKNRTKKALVIPQFKVGKHILSPNQLSEGTFKTISFLFYLLTDRSDLLLMEEPEVCIHHGLLSSIVSAIKDSACEKQIIISTHSDFVLDHVDPANVFAVSNNDKRGTKVVQILTSMSRREIAALHMYLEKEGNLGEYWKHGALENE